MSVKLHWKDREGKVHNECCIESVEELESGRRRFIRRICKNNLPGGKANPLCLGCIVTSGNPKLPLLFIAR